MTETTEPKQSEGEAASGIADMTKGRQEMVEPKWSEGEARVGHRRYDERKTRDGRAETK